MWGKKEPTLLENLRERHTAARMSLIRAEEAADDAAIRLAEANEAVLYAKERLSRLASHIAAVEKEEAAKTKEPE